MRRSLARAGLVVSLTLLGVPLAASAQTAAEVVGTVTDGATGRAVGGQPVSLYGTTSDQPLATTVSETDGTFRLPTAVGGVTVSTTYSGVTYSAELVAGGPTLLSVYPTTASASDVRLGEWMVWIDHDGSVAVQQDVQIVNDGTRTYVGEQPMSGGATAASILPLAEGARDLRFLGAFTACCASVQGATFLHSEPIRPGETSGTVRYVVDELTALTLTPPFDTDALTLLVPTGAQVEADWLDAIGRTEDRGTIYDIYTARDLLAGQPYDLVLSGLAPTFDWLRWGALALSALLVAAAAVLVTWRRRRTRADEAADEAADDAAAEAPVEDVTADAGVGVATAALRLPAAVAVDRAPTDAPTDASGRLPVELLVDELAVLERALEHGLIPIASYEALFEARWQDLLRTAGSLSDLSAALADDARHVTKG